MMDLEPDITVLAQTIARGNTVLVVGAGLSIGAGAPSADDLADDLRKDLWPATIERALPTVAQYFRNQFGSYALHERLRSRIICQSLRPTRAHELLCALPVGTYVTTNWDPLLETALRGAGRRTHVVVGVPDLAGWEDSEVHVIKAHGDLDRPDTLVVAEEDYTRLLYGTAPHRHKLLDLLRYRPVLFLGYSGRDPDIALLYWRAINELGTLPRAAYTLTFDTDAHLRAEWRRRGVRPITINAKPTQGNEALVAILERLVNVTGRFTVRGKTRPKSACDVLVVDDEEGIQSLFKRLLETRLGIRVATASDGMEACMRLAALRPALILVDLIMPRMDGWRLIEVIRENPEYADTQFIIVSGQGSNDSVDRAHAVGIPYLSKLGDLNELVALVEERLANAKRQI